MSNPVEIINGFAKRRKIIKQFAEQVYTEWVASRLENGNAEVLRTVWWQTIESAVEQYLIDMTLNSHTLALIEFQGRSLLKLMIRLAEQTNIWQQLGSTKPRDCSLLKWSISYSVVSSETV
ncbi:hypothetical protein A2533_00705 [Candidatus Falkowbacteria bacterium RIFOXYD2_FULL_35_9]|uniref:Uncharacterized protein n=1 Tax=Candidatus Falkowbacteria bacterium RIFOXYC2_FULL_36_12 TaxID=1798002 RepID=A0A1F5T0E6_9BACT|nr:MAG: hypothetical protein A2300_00075 [Candidatus Falkowbacteria bacterium RIFOXYB2_FULL_35_7]OGF32434.1 MAG: hypothetical protein A2478_03890 [Candidatus Falkowbacteria bacterium RIFOXYC2_FULL_36_12]OGF33836.1 MAG: hypothetical protein A2223_01125 [Candidatus Falkowbacteria bacterium RIFOXYA2_FULL_35_8]OGF46782.1 MAG: hypothetical protein A2533_00705 [Candidatus Falkowbacteria bacterium RIFOXYD2_FULL_35_9]